MKIILTLIACFVTTQSIAGTIGKDCSPRGVINVTKEVISPVSFWKAALKEIDQRLKGEREAYRYNQLERRNDNVRANLDKSEARALGIYDPKLQQEIDRESAETDRMIANLDREMLMETQQWAERCRAYAYQQLAKSK